MGGIKIGIGFGLWGLGLPSPDTICDYAERAEDLGIDSIWLSDHIVARNPSFDIACIMALWAGRTKRIKMGPSVLTMPARDPVQVAKTYATLDYLSGSCNRVIMAVGLGSDPRDCQACGVPLERRGKRMAEAVDVMRKLWAGPHVTHHGEFYRFDDVTIEPRPAKGTLDVWVGGGSDLAIKRAVRYGDGWFPSLVTPQEYAAGLRKMAAFGTRYGRHVDPDETGVLIFTHINDDKARADEVARAFLSDFPTMAPEPLMARSAIGPAETCREKVQAYVDEGCTKFVLWPIAPPEQLVHQVETIGRGIVPEFMSTGMSSPVAH